MTSEDRDQPVLSDADRRFVERVAESFAPPAMTAARRTALDAGVRERLSRPAWSWTLAPALMAASLVAAALLWVGAPLPATPPSRGPAGTSVETLASDGWELRLFYGGVDGSTLEDGEPETLLPPEYAAIDSLFLES